MKKNSFSRQALFAPAHVRRLLDSRSEALTAMLRAEGATLLASYDAAMERLRAEREHLAEGERAIRSSRTSHVRVSRGRFQRELETLTARVRALRAEIRRIEAAETVDMRRRIRELRLRGEERMAALESEANGLRDQLAALRDRAKSPR